MQYLIMPVGLQNNSYRELARADGNCVVAPIPGTNDTTACAIAKVSHFTEASYYN